MDAVMNMRTTIGTSVRKIFSNNPGNKNLNNEQEIKMTLCSICEAEKSDVPFIVRDICKFISQKSIKLEGIFRVSAPVRQINELRDLYETNSNVTDNLLLKQSVTEVTGHAAAGLLKQFFRQLTEPLIHDEIMQIFLESKTASDKDFCDKVSRCMDKWSTPHRCTLTFLLTFLHTVAQESENRMSVNGLAVVFGPNVFRLPDGIEGLQAQAVANQTFERLLSCSHLLAEGHTSVFIKKREPPPRPAPPVFRPLPPTPDEDPAQTTVSITDKPVPAIRTFINGRKHGLDINATDEFDAMPYIDATPETNVTENPLNKPNISCNDSESEVVPQKLVNVPQKPDIIVPQNKSVLPRESVTAPQKIADIEEEATGLKSSNEISEEIVETSDLTEDSKNESIAASPRNILDDSIRQIVQTRLFNSNESSSISDDTDSALKSNGLLPSATAGRVSGPKNRRRPARINRLLNNVRLEDSDEEITTATTQLDQSEKRNDLSNEPEITDSKSPTSSVLNSASVATVMTPDSGCIVDDYPRNSSPIKSELARLDLSPVYIPKLDLRTSLDEEDMAKLRDSALPSTGDIVPQLDLSSVTESAENVDDLKPLKKRELEAQKLSEPGTPPRPTVKPVSTKHGARKKKKKANHKKPHLLSEVTPQPSDCEVIDDNCDETMEEARDKILNVLRDNRRVAGRPFDVSKMSSDELKDEKLSMQRELLKFESRHGRPTTKQSKQLMREVYDRYRAVKRLLASGHSVDENENNIKHDLNDSFLVTRPFPVGSGDHSCEETDVTNDGLLDSPASDILEQVHEMRGRRRKLRRILREFEIERKVQGSNLERRVMRTEYEEYRAIKNKLRNLEIALAKKGVEIP